MAGKRAKRKRLYATGKLCLLLLVEESFGKNTFHSDENGIIGYNGEDLKTKEREDMRWRIVKSYRWKKKFRQSF